MKNSFLTIILLTFCTAAFAQYDTLYVAPTAAGTGSGDSWANARGGIGLAGALKNAVSNEKELVVLLAEGIYYPSTGTNRETRFEISDSIEIWGGFPANGNPTWADRNPWIYPTTLSADIGVKGDTADNAYNVIKGTGTNRTTVLDGLIIRDGNANGSTNWKMNDNGAGIYPNYGSTSLTIRNCTFANNYTTGSGSAIYIRGGWKGGAIENCTFVNNWSEGATVWLGSLSDTSCIIKNCIFINNECETGSAIGNDGIRLFVYNSTFVNNQMNSNNSAVITFNHGYWPDQFGGFYNNVFYNNDADKTINYEPIKVKSNVTFPFVNNFAIDSTLIKNNMVESGTFYGDPMFTNIPNTVGRVNVDTLLAFDVTPANGSPLINAGDTTYGGITMYDAMGNLRVVGLIVDLGAVENPNANPPLTLTIAPVDTQYLDINTAGTALLATANQTATAYKWWYGTEPGTPTTLLTATGMEYIPNFGSSDTFYVVAQAFTATDSALSNEVVIIVMPVSGLKVGQSTQALSVYPNPVSTTQPLQVLVPEQGSVQAQIFTTNGKSVFNQQLATSPNGQININHQLPTGMYILRLSANKHVYTQKVLVK